jgi:hypothetical protein
MCRNIRLLYNFEPPATEAEVRAASLQFVRKVSGFRKPSRANEEAFDHAVSAVADAVRELLESLVTRAPPRDRAARSADLRRRPARHRQPAAALHGEPQRGTRSADPVS